MALPLLLLPLLLFLTALYAAVSYYCFAPARISQAMARQGIAGPPPRLFTGNLTHIAAMVRAATADDMPSVSHNIVGRLLPHYALWSKTYGKRFLYWYGSEPRLCVTDTDSVKELLSSRCVAVTGRSPMQRLGSKDFIGGGVLMANGGHWLHQRHVVAPAFMSDRLKGYASKMVECTRRTIGELREAAGDDGCEVEIGAYMSRLTADIIARTEFGTSYETGKRIFHLLDRLQSLTAQSSRHLWIPGARFLPSKFWREIKQLKSEVDGLLLETINRSRDFAGIGRTSAPYGHQGLLATLLANAEKNDSSFSYDLQLVMDECKTFFFAGHDTSALLLTWSLMLLAANPEWQDKARAEILAVCGDRPPAADDLPKLNTMQMILNETLRLYPPVSLLPRMAFEDMKLGDITVPRGVSVWIPVLAIHHDKERWGADADEFRPERFAGRSFAVNRHFLPFAAGPRNCVGQAYAAMEAKIVLAMALRAFRIALSPGYRHAPVNVLTLKPKHGVLLRLTPLTT